MNSYNNKKSKVNILIHFEKSCFYVGEFIKGNIEINTSSSAIIKDITIEIFLTEEWKLKEGDKTKTFSDKKRVVLYNLNIKSLKVFKIVDEDNLILPIGLTFIPFNFHFSEQNIPCFEFPCPDKRASIRYSFIATIDSTFTNGSAIVPICLLSRPIIETEKKLSASIKQTIKKWKLFGEGDTELKVSFPENNYKYDSICKLKIEIDNTKGKIATKEYKVTLIRTITFTDQEGEIKHKECNKIVRESVKAEVKPGHKNEFEYKLLFKEKNLKKNYNYNMQANPYNIDIEKINFFMPTVKGLLISCDYVIKVCLYFDSFVDNTHRPRIQLPVYLVHQLPADYQMEKQENIINRNTYKESENNRNKVKFISKSYNEKEKFKEDIYNDSLDANDIKNDIKENGNNTYNDESNNIDNEDNKYNDSLDMIGNKNDNEEDGNHTYNDENNNIDNEGNKYNDSLNMNGAENDNEENGNNIEFDENNNKDNENNFDKEKEDMNEINEYNNKVEGGEFSLFNDDNQNNG